MLVKPIWIDPLFNDFGPMKDKALETQILGLADRAGIDGGRVFEVDKSVDTEDGQRLRHRPRSAPSGSSSGTRCCARSDDGEVLAVMGHEMGHYVLGHVAWAIVASLGCSASVGLFWSTARSGGLIARFGRRFGFDRLADVASVPADARC